MNNEPRVSDMVEHYNNHGVVEITTEDQKRRGSMVFFDRIASGNGTRVEYIFNTRSGLTYRKVNDTAYPINYRPDGEYSREFKRSRAMVKAINYINSFRMKS